MKVIQVAAIFERLAGWRHRLDVDLPPNGVRVISSLLTGKYLKKQCRNGCSNHKEVHLGLVNYSVGFFCL